MRVLVSTTANEGHFAPMVGLAQACVAAGDEVRVAAPASYARSVEQAGLAHAPFADAPPELVGPLMGRLAGLTFEEANALVVRDVFGRLDAQAALPALVDLVTAWRPDVVVREPAELASLTAAVRAGVPHAQVAIGMQEMSRLFEEHMAEPLGELAGLAGVADSLPDQVAVEPLLTTVPRTVDRAGDDRFRDDVVLLRYRDEAPPASGDTLPAWGDPDLPLVYVTFGSVTGSLPPFAGVFREALDALADLPVRVLMTVGRRMDVDVIGPVPANARVERWWPQQDVLRAAAALLGHGGFGTTMGALRSGVPQVVVPLFSADQSINARHVAAAGAGLAVAQGPDGIAQGCRRIPTLLSEPALREGARAAAAASAALPGVGAAVEMVHALAR